MNERSFADRVKATGLNPKPEDITKLEVLVMDMDRIATLVRGPRAYAQEPMSAFRVPAAGPG